MTRLFAAIEDRKPQHDRSPGGDKADRGEQGDLVKAGKGSKKESQITDHRCDQPTVMPISTRCNRRAGEAVSGASISLQYCKP